MKKALITGITGQDGSFLAEFLLGQGYEVHGTVRRVAIEDPAHRLWRLRGVLDRVTLHSASLENYASMFSVIAQVMPDECYHLAAQSFVSYSFDDAFSTMDVNIQGTHHVLSSLAHLRPDCRFYFAGSSEMFGKVAHSPQTEDTPFHPRSPYGISKVAGFHLTQNYRESRGMFACSGMLFNHESERRGFEFVTRKISYGVARIKLGLDKTIRLGNLQAKRDWGYAPEYVQAMWKMLQQDQPRDYVVGTGRTNTVEEFAQRAFAVAGLDWQKHVVLDEALYRPAEVQLLHADPAKAARELGWSPKVTCDELAEIMVRADIERLRAGN